MKKTQPAIHLDIQLGQIFLTGFIKLEKL